MELLTYEEVSKELGVDTRTVKRWVSSGAFPEPIRLSYKCVRFDKGDISKWLHQKKEVQEKGMGDDDGVHLDAIRHSDLSPTQKHILFELTCRMDFRKSFQDPIIVSKGSIARFTGLGQEAVGRNLIRLEKQGYVIQSREPGSSNTIRLTSKVFDEYAAKMGGVYQNGCEVKKEVQKKGGEG